MKKILIVDYLVGGGFAEEDLPQDHLAEGYSLLRAAIEQFSFLGYKIATLIDQRLMEHIRISPIHEFNSVASHEDFVNGIQTFSDQVDYSLTIAPESKGILKDLASIMVNSSSTYLGCTPESIELAADKLKTMALAKELDLNVPATFSPNYNEPFDAIAEKVQILGYPLIVKPVDGIGCRGLTKALNLDGLRFGLQSAHAVTNMEECIVQEFIEGTPISTSLLVNDEKAYPLSINHQNLRMDSNNQFGRYIGGEVPFNVPNHNKEIIETSIKLVEQMNLTGFVGVDMIVSKEGLFIIEVNPRLTVPFIGIKNLSSKNIGQMLIDVVENGTLNEEIKLKGHATFSKLAVPSAVKNRGKFEKVTVIDGVLSPPFPIGNNTHSYALIMGLGSTRENARKDFQRVKNELLNNLS